MNGKRDSMSKFTFKVVNNTGLEVHPTREFTLIKDFFTGNPSHSFSAETLVGSRLYVGYGSMPPAPDPHSNPYYGCVEFSRNNVDKGVWRNLSNVDIVGLPLTLKGKLADDGKPFSLGYKKPVKDIISDIPGERQVALPLSRGGFHRR